MSFEIGSNAYGSATCIETLDMGNPKFMSIEVQEQLYELITTNIDNEELFVTRCKPSDRLMKGACMIDFQYDVVLSGRNLCKVYQNNCLDSDRVIFYIFEFQNEHYDTSDLFGGYSRNGHIKGEEMCEKIVTYWKQEEKKKAEALKKSTENSHHNFLSGLSAPGKVSSR